MLVEAGGEREGVLHRELRAGSDREVRGVRGVAEQHDIAVVPVLVAHRREADPSRVVRVHLMAVQDAGEKTADLGDARLIALAGRKASSGVRVEARSSPHVVVHLDDERAARGVIWIAVNLHDPVRRLDDVELERVEDEIGAEPHEPAAAHVETRVECAGKPRPRGGVHAVRADDEVM